MAIKILGGKYKGKNLKLPPSSITRPMSSLLKRRVFDYYQNLEGVAFIDLCAGSGAVGIEASSRLADPVILIEKSDKVFKILKDNIQNVEDEDKPSQIQKHCRDCFYFLNDFKVQYESWTKENRENTILFFAPPYPMHELYQKLPSFINNWFEGQLWLESDELKGLNRDELSKLYPPAIKEYKQGSSFLLIINYDL